MREDVRLLPERSGLRRQDADEQMIPAVETHGDADDVSSRAQPLLQRFGVTSTCRASLALYSGKDDIDALVEGIEKAREFFA